MKQKLTYCAPDAPRIKYEVQVFDNHVMVHRTNTLIGVEQSVMLSGQEAESLHTDLLRIELTNEDAVATDKAAVARLRRLF